MDLSLFLVSAMFGRFSASLGWARPVWGVSGWFPFTYGWAVTSALRAAREHAPLGVWLPGVVALVAYAVSGCPCGCAWLVRLRGFPCFLERGVVRWDCVCVYLCAPGFVNGAWWCVRVARFVSGGVFYYVRRGVPAWLFVCRLCPALSHVAGLLRFVLFVGYCVVCVS